MTTWLGRTLRYVTEAVAYAAAPFRSGKSSSLWMQALRSMSAGGTLTAQDTLDVDGALRLAITSAWAYSAIKLIADRVASSDARPVVKRRLGEKLVNMDNHAFEQLLRQPNSLMTADFIFAYLTWWVYLLGNGYLFISTQAPGIGTPEELWPLPANLVRPLPETLRPSRLTGGQCIDYEYSVGGRQFKLPGENVIHIRLPNPFDYWVGLSPLSAALMGLKIDHGEQRFVHAHYTEDNAVPPAIISLPAEISPTDFEIAKEQIREQFAGQRRTAVTRAGDLHVQVLQQTLEQMQHVETRKFNREEIFLVYGVPEGMLTGGISGDSRLATEIAFTRNTVQPFLNRIASELTANVAPYYGPEIEICAPSIVPQDRALEIQEYSMYSMDRTINENRERLNLPPIDLAAVVQKINALRQTLGLGDEVALADASLALLLDLPVRLHPFITSSTFTAATPPAYANVPNPPEVGDLPGMMGGENFVAHQAVRAAIGLGMETELKRWEKVALKAVRTGRDPGQIRFTSAVLSDRDLERITVLLHHATEDAVRKVFADELARIAGAASPAADLDSA